MAGYQSEAQYLAENPDVAAAIKKGMFKSGKQHYDRFGKAEIAKGTRKPVSQQPAQPQAHPVDQLMNQALNQDLIKKATIRWEELNPFSTFFNEDLARKVISGDFQKEFDRQNQQLTDQDTSFRRDEGIAHEKNTQNLVQNLSNNGALFGGVRSAQTDELNTTRSNRLSDYAKEFNNRKFELERQQKRTTDELLQAEKTNKYNEWQDQKKRDLGTQFKSPGYSY